MTSPRHIPTLRAHNPALTSDTVIGCFEDVCGCSTTDNKTTSMLAKVAKVEEVLKERGVVVSEQMMKSCQVKDLVYTPALISLLQSAVCGDGKVFALIVVDVQNDFISGSLAVKEGEKVVPVINSILPHFSHVYKTADWHPANHISFHPNVSNGLYPTSPRSQIEGKNAEMFQTVVVQGPPELEQTLWPVHCVQGSDGAEFHKELKKINNENTIEKGMNPQVDSYSAFWDNGDTDHTPLYSLLVQQGVTDVVVCGLATDYCVGFTALDAARHGFRTMLVIDAARGVADTSTKPMFARCQAAGVEFIVSTEIPGILQGDTLADLDDRIFRARCQKEGIDLDDSIFRARFPDIFQTTPGDNISQTEARIFRVMKYFSSNNKTQ